MNRVGTMDSTITDSCVRSGLRETLTCSRHFLWDPVRSITLLPLSYSAQVARKLMTMFYFISAFLCPRPDMEIVFDSEVASPTSKTNPKPSIRVLVCWRLFTKSLPMSMRGRKERLKELIVQFSGDEGEENW
jgi:hypothetical protein